MRHGVRRPAFTLVELLVVISVIALLVSILLPSLRKARRQARAVLCGSSLHQQGIALDMYFQEYNGYIPREMMTPYGNRLPYAAFLTAELGLHYDETQPLEPQFAKMPEFQCADFPKGVPTIDGKLSDDQPLDYVYNDFYLNYEEVVYTEDDELLPSINPLAFPRLEYVVRDAKQLVRISWVRKPAAIIFLSEAHRELPTLLGAHDVTRGMHLPRGIYPRVANSERHPSGIHSLYLDLHIERAKPEKQTLKDWYDPTAHATMH
ncbi:MAG TPA: type II secretion system protein [Phycisphaerae bacterium]|nr:type II secretion system protein [Phycisphaerales bacterium]HRX85410.1 type II secretion system protein [Phycisphaerae bacterium]